MTNKLELPRCIHEMIVGTCALCKGYPQTVIGTSSPTYLHENFFYRLRSTTGRLLVGGDPKGDYNQDE